MLVLGIESSCDETSAAIVEDGRNVLSNIVYSQIDIHTQFGGVVPEIASRKHVEKISYVVDKCIKDAKISINDIDVISATYGPGLVGSLLVGLSFAKGLSYSLKKPFVGVNHVEGHIFANFLTHKDLEPPLIVLVVSGGHTNILVMERYNNYKVYGKTRDDAVGEAFDKIARYLNLGYPGGPIIDKLAKDGNENRYIYPDANLENPYDFSFSGLKSAVINHINTMKQKKEDFKVEDVVASFQKTAVNTLIKRVINLCFETGIKKVAIAGGVAANTKLRQELLNSCLNNDIKLYIPEIKYCTDNAAMIASNGYFKYINGEENSLSINAVPYISLVSKNSI
ncbi:tRNA (adenosine(37)-N6)-threonylcarbamoyltransferase complex transferase subunit TsaD [Caldicellulosiruptoraceae bacterium PP1]